MFRYTIIFNISIDPRYRPATTDGPVLSQTDLYLLGTELQLNPILMNMNPKFHLVFNLLSGSFISLQTHNAPNIAN